MSRSTITHSAALKALVDLYSAVVRPDKTQADLQSALDYADAVLTDTYFAGPADRYCAAKQAKEAAKARLKASKRKA
jgi:hypothetical protein